MSEQNKGKLNRGGSTVSDSSSQQDLRTSANLPGGRKSKLEKFFGSEFSHSDLSNQALNHDSHPNVNSEPIDFGDSKDRSETHPSNNHASTNHAVTSPKLPRNEPGEFKKPVGPRITSPRSSTVGKDPGVFVLPPVLGAPVLSSSAHKIIPKQKVHSYEILKDPLTRPKACDTNNLEQYLSDEEFDHLFQVSREDFSKMPKFQQTNLKTRLGLM